MCKHMKNVRSSQPGISMNFSVKHKVFHVSIVKHLDTRVVKTLEHSGTWGTLFTRLKNCEMKRIVHVINKNILISSFIIGHILQGSRKIAREENSPRA